MAVALWGNVYTIQLYRLNNSWRVQSDTPEVTMEMAGVFLLSCGEKERPTNTFNYSWTTHSRMRLKSFMITYISIIIIPFLLHFLKLLSYTMHYVCSQDILQPTVAKGGGGGGGGEVGEEAGEDPENTSHKKTRKHRDRTSSDGTRHKKKLKSRHSAKDADQTF